MATIANHLEVYKKFPDVNIKRNNGQVSTIRIRVNYVILGPKELAAQAVTTLEKEWDYTEAQIKNHDENQHDLHVEYQVKANEVSQFLEKVRYRTEWVPPNSSAS